MFYSFCIQFMFSCWWCFIIRPCFNFSSFYRFNLDPHRGHSTYRPRSLVRQSTLILETNQLGLIFNDYLSVVHFFLSFGLLFFFFWYTKDISVYFFKILLQILYKKDKNPFCLAWNYSNTLWRNSIISSFHFTHTFFFGLFCFKYFTCFCFLIILFEVFLSKLNLKLCLYKYTCMHVNIFTKHKTISRRILLSLP